MIDKIVSGKKKNHTVTITVFRDNVLREFRVKLRLSPVPEYAITKVSDPTPMQKLIYERWLSTKWE